MTREEARRLLSGTASERVGAEARGDADHARAVRQVAEDDAELFASLERCVNRTRLSPNATAEEVIRHIGYGRAAEHLDGKPPPDPPPKPPPVRPSGRLT